MLIAFAGVVAVGQHSKLGQDSKVAWALDARMLGLLLPRAGRSLSLSYLPRVCLDRSLASTAGHNLKFAFSYCVDQVK